MSLKKYMTKYMDPRLIEGKTGRSHRLAIVIPAFAEMEALPRTLESLLGNPRSELDEAMVLVVVNNPPPDAANSGKIGENSEMLGKLRSSQFPFQDGLNLYWIDASGPGREIDEKEGVGAARKLGMDAALELVGADDAASLIVSLDADTVVEGNYLASIRGYFNSNPDVSGASISFAHQPGTSSGEDEAITRYELFMRYYAAGLKFARSPYAYHVLGSAMAFRAGEYVRAGGMRKRNGGEDFYFMQALRKVGPVGEITDTVVHPSSRPSDRVPFGTGPRISQVMDGTRRLKFYNPRIFTMLGELFSMVARCEKPDTPFDAGKIDPVLKEFLDMNGFFSEWGKILRNTPQDPGRIRWAFHVWFDAFRTLKFVHSCEKGYPGFEAREAYAALFASCGHPLSEEAFASEKILLDFIRRRQG